jgi:DNA-binding CsgD family transcriptional regulator
MMKSTVETFKALEALPVSAAILDASGTIVAVNDAWKDFGRRNGLRVPNSGIGLNYVRYCGSDHPHSSRLAKDLKQLLAGRLDLLTLIYPCHSPSRKRWFTLVGLPLSLDKPAGVALLHINLTDMLPLSRGGGPTRVKADRRGKIRPATSLDMIGGAIEDAVLATVSSQLDTMLSDSPQVASHENIAQHREPTQVLARARLSKRQVQVLRLLGEGKTNKEIARALLRSPNTIKLHVSAILQRLKLKSRTQAALLASTLLGEEASGLAGVKSRRKERLAAVPRKPARTIRRTAAISG